jgi:8-oxo-dGTP diphosphatase
MIIDNYITKLYKLLLNFNKIGEKMNNQIILQNVAGAFLINNGKYLLMLRSSDKQMAPGLWSCVGGKMEANDLNNPMETCLREIKEETGIDREKIYNLELRYLIIRQSKNIIRHSYIYFGETDEKKIKNTNEGTLHWIPENELLDREYSQTYTEMIKHYLQKVSSKNKIIVGIAGNHQKQLKMTWSVLEDFK